MPTNHKGFTLIELLVVIAIIAILAAILFPVFARAREKARQTTCTNNQRQIAVGITMYSQDHGELMPASTSVWNDINLDRGILRCPTLGTTIPNGYGYNSAISNLSIGYIKSPSDTLLTADISSSAALPNILSSGADIDTRHSSGYIASAVDGHVGLYKGSPQSWPIYQLNSTDADSGSSSNTAPSAWNFSDYNHPSQLQFVQTGNAPLLGDGIDRTKDKLFNLTVSGTNIYTTTRVQSGTIRSTDRIVFRMVNDCPTSLRAVIMVMARGDTVGKWWWAQIGLVPSSIGYPASTIKAGSYLVFKPLPAPTGGVNNVYFIQTNNTAVEISNYNKVTTGNKPYTVVSLIQTQ
jgi:prepilin-type N-terminal cleavage/methylation domain-containing protein